MPHTNIPAALTEYNCVHVVLFVAAVLFVCRAML
jgi:hypothetical protein